MPASKDYMPQNFAAFAVWLKNLATELPGALAAKYSVNGAAIAQLLLDAAWVDFWVDAKATARQQEGQVVDFIDAVLNGALGSTPQDDPVWALPLPFAALVPPGIRKRIREIVAGIKAQKSIYTIADGELLGIVTPEEANTPEEDYTPDAKLRSLANFGLEADFRKFGLDGLRVEFRHKDGPWQLAAFLTTSPGVFNIIPLVPGNAEQIEIRCIFIKDNLNYGNYSPIYSVVIAP